MFEVEVRNRVTNESKTIRVEAKSKGDAWFKARAILANERKDIEDWYIRRTTQVS